MSWYQVQRWSPGDTTLHNCPQSAITTFLLVFPSLLPKLSTFLTTFRLSSSATLPNTTCFPSSLGGGGGGGGGTWFTHTGCYSYRTPSSKSPLPRVHRERMVKCLQTVTHKTLDVPQYPLLDKHQPSYKQSSS